MIQVFQEPGRAPGFEPKCEAFVSKLPVAGYSLPQRFVNIEVMLRGLVLH